MNQDIKNLILESAKKNSTSWVIVRSGIVAEFSIVPGDDVKSSFEDNTLKVQTPRASLSLEFDDSISDIVAESGAHGCSPWSQNIHLAIPKDQAQMSCRDKLTFLGNFKEDSIEGKLWDLGVGNKTLDACIIADSDTHLLLQQREDQYILDDPKFLRELIQHSPVRLFKSKFASILVKQKIPLSESDEIDGPHTHLLPPIIRRRKQVLSPIPDHMESIIQVNPFVSVIDGNGQFYKWNGFEDDKFQELLQKHGDESYTSRKNQLLQKILDCINSENTQQVFEIYKDEKNQDAIRIILAQIVCDETHDKDTRQKTLVLLERLHSINLKGLKRWVENMAPEIST